jgi:ribokinase
MSGVPEVVVVGSINADLVIGLPVLPGRGETVSGNTPVWLPGGKGANQALAAARMGARVRLIGAVGPDEAGAIALTNLREAGVELELTPTHLPTSIAVVLVETTGENQIVVADGANSAVQVESSLVETAAAVICQLEIADYAILAAANACTGLFVLNAAPAREVWSNILDRVDVLIVNEHEFEALGKPTRGVVVVTSGAAGASAYQDGQLIATAVPPAVSVVDTVGAGDTFVGAFVTSLVSGQDLATSLRRAVFAGALAVTQVGAQSAIPTAQAVDALMANS